MDFRAIEDLVSLKEFADDHLERVGSKYVCPICSSGTGPNHSAAFSIYKSPSGRDRWKCFSCENGGNVFDLAKEITKTDGIVDAAKYVAGWARIDVDGDFKKANVQRRERKPEPEIDYTENRAKEAQYIKKHHTMAALKRCEYYLNSRGYTVEQAYKLGFGYDPCGNGARYVDEKTGEEKWCDYGRLIIPWLGSDYYHIDRSTDFRAKEYKYKKPYRKDVGAQPIFNPDAIKKSDTIFVCEGAFDALAVIAAGGTAMCLGGSGFYEVANYLRKNNYKGNVVVMLDNDKTGIEKTPEFVAALAKPSNDKGDCVKCVAFDWAQEGLGKYKDAGDVLADNKELLVNAVKNYQIEKPTISQVQNTTPQDQGYSNNAYNSPAARPNPNVSASNLADNIKHKQSYVKKKPNGENLRSVETRMAAYKRHFRV